MDSTNSSFPPVEHITTYNVGFQGEELLKQANYVNGGLCKKVFQFAFPLLWGFLYP